MQELVSYTDPASAATPNQTLVKAFGIGAA
jgi:hypothetical protein